MQITADALGMSDVTFGKTEQRAVTGSGLLGQNSPFSSSSFLEREKGDRRAGEVG